MDSRQRIGGTVERAIDLRDTFIGRVKGRGGENNGDGAGGEFG
jgi:hypothetical protein